MVIAMGCDWRSTWSASRRWRMKRPHREAIKTIPVETPARSLAELLPMSRR